MLPAFAIIISDGMFDPLSDVGESNSTRGFEVGLSLLTYGNEGDLIYRIRDSRVKGAYKERS